MLGHKAFYKYLIDRVNVAFKEKIAERERLAGNVPSKPEDGPRFEPRDHKPPEQSQSDVKRSGFDAQDSFEQGRRVWVDCSLALVIIFYHCRTCP